MKVLIIGSSSKEHALVWKLLGSEKFKNIEIICVPGNYALKKVVECVDDVDVSDIDRILEIAIARNVNLTICGESKLFEKAIVDKFKLAQKLILGPNKMASLLESSHVFAKNLMMKYEIPCAKFVAFDHQDMAMAFLNTASFPLRLRADKIFDADPASVVAHDFKQARRVLMEMFKQKFLSRAQAQVVIEETVEGADFTINTICDGNRALSLPPVQAYREDDESGYISDKGAYAPTPILNDKTMYRIRTEIIDPVVNAMKEEGMTYTGILAFDITLDLNDAMNPKLIQCRSNLADSDAQVVLPLLDEDLFEILSAAAQEDLSFYKDGFHKYLGSALSVNIVNADRTIDNFSPIHSMQLIEELDEEVAALQTSLGGVPLVFYGTKYLEKASRKIGQTEIFGATAIAENLLDAQVLAYKLADSIALPSKSYQRDIGDNGMI